MVGLLVHLVTRFAKNMAKDLEDSSDYIVPLNMNGLEGRLLKLPPASPKKHREILLVYGHHASIERLLPMAQYLSKYGPVSLPDLPGVGGMEAFYKIGQKPSIDNMADYLASFIKLRYKNKRFTLIAMSLGFSIVTRMLQRHPSLAKQVDLLVSVVGFVHKDDFRWKRRNFVALLTISRFFSRRLPAAFAKRAILNKPVITSLYRLAEKKHPKFKGANDIQRDERIAYEINLWKINEFRTYADLAVSMMTMNLCAERVDLKVYHIAVADDHYFDNIKVEQHLRLIYKDVELVETVLPAHMPTMLASEEEVAPLIPPKIRQLLNRDPG